MSEATGPVRWRVTIAGCEPDLYGDRRRALAAAKLARLRGHAVTLTRVETTSRRWRVGDARCYAWRGFRYWSFTVLRQGEASLGCGQRESYQEAVEAAERCARGQR